MSAQRELTCACQLYTLSALRDAREPARVMARAKRRRDADAPDAPSGRTPRGQVVVVGARGAGKTTLVNALVASLLELPAPSSSNAARAAPPPRLRAEETLRGREDRATFLTATARAAQEGGDVYVHPDGPRAQANVLAQPSGELLPVAKTVASVVVKPAPRDAAFLARVTIAYREEQDIARVVTRGREAMRIARIPDVDVDVGAGGPDDGDGECSSSASPRPAAAAGLRARDAAELAAILGCDDANVAAALKDRSKAYLPSRFRDLLGATRTWTVRAYDGAAAAAAVKKEKASAAGPELALAAACDATRAYLHRVAHGPWSHWGCIQGDVIVELPLPDDFEIVDTPGLPRGGGGGGGGGWAPGAHARTSVARSLRSNVIDCLLCVMDGAAGPSHDAAAVFEDSRVFDAMVRRADGGALALAWPLDNPSLEKAAKARGVERDAYVATQSALVASACVEERPTTTAAAAAARGGDDEGGTFVATEEDGGDSWIGLVESAARRNGGVVNGAMAAPGASVRTYFGRVRRGAGGEKNALAASVLPPPRDTFESLVAHFRGVCAAARTRRKEIERVSQPPRRDGDDVGGAARQRLLETDDDNAVETKKKKDASSSPDVIVLDDTESEEAAAAEASPSSSPSSPPRARYATPPSPPPPPPNTEATPDDLSSPIERTPPSVKAPNRAMKRSLAVAVSPPAAAKVVDPRGSSFPSEYEFKSPEQEVAAALVGGFTKENNTAVTDEDAEEEETQEERRVEVHPSSSRGGAPPRKPLLDISQARSIHWSPYDPVRVVNADP